MTFLYYSNLLPIAIVTIIYSLVSTAHRILLPQMYCSLFCFKYQGNVRKTCSSTAIRILFTIILTMLFDRILHLSNTEIYLGVFLACFLNIWPAIIQYRLLSFYRSKEKFIMFVGYISFIFFSVTSSWLTIMYLIPSVYENKDIAIFDNTGISIIATILLYIFPISLDGLLARLSFLGNGIDLDTYLEEIKIVDTLLYCEQGVLDLYSYEIKEICKKYDIPIELLKTIIALEYVYRGRWYYRILEMFLCKFFPQIAIKKDISVGIAQIKVSTAKKIKKECPLKFIKTMYKPEVNIELCAAYLKSVIDDYNKKDTSEYTVRMESIEEDEELFEDETIYDEEDMDEDIDEYVDEYAISRTEIDKEDIFNFIASNYLCGYESELNRTVMVYSSILRSRVKEVKNM